MTSADLQFAGGQNRGRVNYVEDEAASAFFAAREAEAYFGSLKSVDEKRAFHDQLIETLTRFLRAAEGPGKALVDELLARAQAAESMETEYAPQLTGSAMTGLRLLAVGVDVDTETLRSAYRAAALRYHPDRGGSNEDMAAINEAYEQLHVLALNRLGVDQPGMRLAIGEVRLTSVDYCWTTTRLLFDVALDDWALEDALRCLEELTVGHLATSAFGGTANQRVDLLQPSVKLAERLSAAKRVEEAQQALGVAQDVLPRIRETGLNYEYFASVVEEGAAVVSGAAKPRFVINHMRQLENASRLGVLDDKKYATILARLNKRGSDKEAALASENTALASADFLQALPTDRVSAGTLDGKSLVPQPGYFQVHVEDLSSEQQAEYLRAYADNQSLELIQKYAWVRLSSLFRAAIYHSGAVDVTALVAEMRLLGELQPKCAPHAADVLRVMNVLAGLAPDDQAAYAQNLQRLLEPEATRVGGLVITMSTPASELSATFIDSALKAAKRFNAPDGEAA